MVTKGVAGVGAAVAWRVAGIVVGTGVETAVKSVVGGKEVTVAVGSSAMGIDVGSGVGADERQPVISKISKNRTTIRFFFALINHFLVLAEQNQSGRVY
jgi:hypothetical protein